MRTGLEPSAYSRTMFTRLNTLPVKRGPSRVANRTPEPSPDRHAELVREIDRRPGRAFIALVRNALALKLDPREIGPAVLKPVQAAFPGFTREDARAALDFKGLTQVEV